MSTDVYSRVGTRPKFWLLAVLAAIGMAVVGIFQFPAAATPAGTGDDDPLNPTEEGGNPDEEGVSLPELDEEPQVNTGLPSVGVETFGGQIGTFAAGTITGPNQSAPWGAPASGPGWIWNFAIGDAPIHWLGAMKPGDSLEWCRNFDSAAPVGPGTPVALTPRPLHSDPDVAAAQVTSNAQMGWILENYSDMSNVAGVDWADQSIYRAAISTIVHLSYEEGGGVQYLPDLVDTLTQTENGRLILTWSGNLVRFAKTNAGVPDGSGEVVVGENKQDFNVTNVGVKQGSKWLGSIPVTVKIVSGNGVFDADPEVGSVSADGLTWTGTTSTAGALSIPGHSTANGDIITDIKFSGVPYSSVQGLARSNNTQDTVVMKPSFADPSVTSEPREVVYDFQPVAVSNVGDAHLVGVDTGELFDSLVVSTEDDEAWLGVLRTYPGMLTYEPLPVTFKGTAYYAGVIPPSASAQVPADAVVVAEASFVAEGPGTYDVTATLDRSAMPTEGGFVTWVWEVDKADQPEIAEDELYMLRSSWDDGYGTDDEISSVLWEGKIESNIKIHPTNDNTYLVDDVWVSGLPKDHPTFEGGRGFAADTKELTQSLYFWEGKFDDEIVSVDDAELIGSVEIAAKNGFYPSVGDMDFKLVRDADGELVPGTYQFVHDFAGDDRVQAFQSLIPDVHEQYVVTAEPQIGTTAMGSVEDLVGAFEDVTITDEVCYLNLIPGKEYELKGTLMNQSTGKALLVDGKEVKASKKFTAESAEGCETIEFTFNSSALAGATTVVFEDLYQDGVLVATHADIEDEGQTVYIPKLGTTATTPDGGKLVKKEKTAKIVDKACYANLREGREYEIKGKLMDKSTGKPLVSNGKEVTASKKFTADTADGCVELEFTFDSTVLAGREVVVFEDLYRTNVKIAAHADINDSGQTVRVEGDVLAKTGAAGVVGMAGVGLGLVAAGGSFLVLRRRATPSVTEGA